MTATFKIIDLGRDKWTGIVKAQSDEPEHVEHALLLEVKKHVMSRDIDFQGDTDAGFIVVGGFRVVGKYRRLQTEAQL